MRRVSIIVLDSLGVGALQDAAEYGDAGVNTLRSIVESKKDLMIPNLVDMGLFNIDGAAFDREKKTSVTASFARLGEMSKGKDTITGHWEIAGLYTEVPFKTFERFPDSFIHAFEKAIGMKILGNYAASGTEIIKQLGKQHKETGSPIVYTSADSVFQIAADTEVIPLEKLYDICEIARKMLTGDVQVGRVIARPFIVKDGQYIRTSDRKDYSVSPSGKTVLDMVKDSGQTVFAIGKISDIFNGQGISKSVHTVGNQDGIDKTIEALNQDFDGLIFTNLVDFDSKFGHRRDGYGYAICLEEFDKRLPEIRDSMKEYDILILCADHGNDPCHTGWDHTREYTPMLICGNNIRNGVNLGTRDTFADIAATVSEYLGVSKTPIGSSFLKQVLK